jgi:myo-inositol 2-dehydrogenase / D-chiro-inositol 1-dehydrogenase
MLPQWKTCRRLHWRTYIRPRRLQVPHSSHGPHAKIGPARQEAANVSVEHFRQLTSNPNKVDRSSDVLALRSQSVIVKCITLCRCHRAAHYALKASNHGKGHCKTVITSCITLFKTPGSSMRAYVSILLSQILFTSLLATFLPRSLSFVPSSQEAGPAEHQIRVRISRGNHNLDKMVRKLRVAVSGLGRMGARHARHFLERTPRAELVAACDPDPKARAWGEQHLAPYGTRIYEDYDEMLKHAGLEAVVVAGITSEHAPQTIKAIQANLHVLTEKPLSTSIDTCQAVLDAAKARPHLKVLCGFSRRFDASYREAFQRVDAGDIGRATVIRSQTCDKFRDDQYFVNYAKYSGGIFVDANIHDIDLTLWFFGQDSIVKSVSAFGVVARYAGLKQYGDVDNGIAVVEFWGGKIAYYYSTRMMMAGQHDATEIIGTHGKLTVNANPAMNLVESHEPTGIRREIAQTYYDRFEHAFVQESNEFTAACLDDTKLPFKLSGAVQAVKIGVAMQKSLRLNRKIDFDELGNEVEVEKARL